MSVSAQLNTPKISFRKLQEDEISVEIPEERFLFQIDHKNPTVGAIVISCRR